MKRTSNRWSFGSAVARLALAAAALMMAAALVGGAGVVRAEEPDAGRPIVEITPGRARAFQAAVQRFVDLAEPPNAQRSNHLRAAIGEALDFSGVLLPLDPAAYLGPEQSDALSNRGRNDCGDWTQSGADALVEGEIHSEGDLLVIDFAVWDTARCVRLMRSSLRRPRSEAPRLARSVGDAIVGAFTGTPGAASTEIAFVSTRTGHSEIFVMDASGANPRPATNSRSIKTFPDWLPDGEGIVYSSYTRQGDPGLFLSSRGAARPGPLLAGAIPGAPKYRGVFDPSGDFLALVASVDESTHVFRVRREGQQVLQLTRGRSIEVGPTWSPDGQQIAFVSDRTGAPQIYVMDRDGGNMRRLTFQGSYNTSPAWSPDGRWIAYETRLVGQFDIWLIDPGGDVNVPLVVHPRSDEDPTWSPDSRKLAFSSTRRGRADIYVMDVNGEKLERLTERKGENRSPSWGPFPQAR
ncbi:MAG: PD40 domain-containing protein [Deltaproteobacteria bacterium]|nr:PD40 domain-containing protein [Deltaproteobacteria bacterium]